MSILSGKKCLVVDDYPDMRSMLRHMMQSLGVGGIDLVENGKNAIKAMESNRYDVILCDYNLGDGKNGQQVLEEAHHKGLIGYASAFIIITAESSREVVMGAVESEPDDYLTKPFNKGLLSKRLIRQLQRKEQLTEVSQLATKHRYHDAIDLCNKLLTSASKNRAPIYKARAHLAETIGDLEGAESVYKEVLDQRFAPWASFGHASILFKGNYSPPLARLPSKAI